MIATSADFISLEAKTMAGKNPMHRFKAAKLYRVCAWLIKGYCWLWMSIVVVSLFSGLIGFQPFALLLFMSLFPWLLRGGLAIGITLIITSLSEAL
jgi:hypothetical protein